MVSRETTVSAQAGDRDVLRLEVLVQSVTSTLSAEARLLHAPKGATSLEKAPHSRRPCRLPAHEPLGKHVDIPRVEVRGQAKLCCIGRLDDPCLRFERKDWCHRAECFFARDAHLSSSTHQHRGLKKQPAELMPRAPTEHARTMRHSVSQMGLYLLNSSLLDQRTNLNTLPQAGATRSVATLATSFSEKAATAPDWT